MEPPVLVLEVTGVKSNNITALAKAPQSFVCCSQLVGLTKSTYFEMPSNFDHQWKRKKLMTVYGTATSLYTLARITSGHAYLPLAYILTYTIIYYIHLYHITIKLSPTYKNGHNLTNIMYNTLHIIKCIYKLLQPGTLSGQPLGYCNPM